MVVPLALCCDEPRRLDHALLLLDVRVEVRVLCCLLEEKFRVAESGPVCVRSGQDVIKHSGSEFVGSPLTRGQKEINRSVSVCNAVLVEVLIGIYCVVQMAVRRIGSDNKRLLVITDSSADPDAHFFLYSDDSEQGRVERNKQRAGGMVVLPLYFPDSGEVRFSCPVEG